MLELSGFLFPKGLNKLQAENSSTIVAKIVKIQKERCVFKLRFIVKPHDKEIKTLNTV